MTKKERKREKKGEVDSAKRLTNGRDVDWSTLVGGVAKEKVDGVVRDMRCTCGALRTERTVFVGAAPSVLLAEVDRSDKDKLLPSRLLCHRMSLYLQ